jgi:organic hydroperoxide reductase OsmC/OhrA
MNVQEYPHRYSVSAAGRTAGHVVVSADGVHPIDTAPPAEFGGPGDKWSPESLLVAAVANCFVLSFRAIARASRLEWNAVSCDVIGVLEKVDGITRFTAFEVDAVLEVPPGTDVDKARRLVEKAENACLITNSLIGERRLRAEVRSAD